MKKFNYLLIAFLTFTTLVYSQSEEATTKSGKKVSLSSDGTWKYVEETIKQISANNTSDCSNYIETEVDKMTGKTTVSGKKTIIVSTDGGKKGFGILLIKGSSGTIIFSIQAVGAGSCIEEGSKINILFVDGSKLELSSDGKFNCKGNATVYFGSSFGKLKQLEELKSKKIQTMRVWTSDGYVEKDFSIENSTEFINTISCLSALMSN